MAAVQTCARPMAIAPLLTPKRCTHGKPVVPLSSYPRLPAPSCTTDTPCSTGALPDTTFFFSQNCVFMVVGRVVVTGGQCILHSGRILMHAPPPPPRA